MRALHVLTPGDHFSPSTGSAIATVVHGLCAHDSGPVRPAVAVAEGTYANRYTSAQVLEYEAAAPARLPAGVKPALADAVFARAGLPRVFARRSLKAVLTAQPDWIPSYVVGHNAPQLPALVRLPHAPVLYAHNELLRTYTRRETVRALGNVHRIICVSAFLADRTSVRLHPTLRDRVRVVRNGVDVRLFRRRTPLRSTDRLEVALVARMTPDKGADVLVEALVRLGRPDVHLTLVGSRGFSATERLTPYERSVRTAATRLGDAVTVHPFLPRAQVAHILGSADVVVVPSRWAEPFALTVLEGMASGAAVIGSDVGGIPETLSGVGTLVQADDADALADAIEAYAADEDLLRRHGRAGRAYAEAHDWSVAAAALASALF